MSGPVEDPNTEEALRVLGTQPGRPLELNGVPLAELATTFGTPLYVFSAAILRSRLAAVQAALGPRFDVLWSVKANPSVAVTAALRRAGAGAEIASIGELEVALAAGHSAGDLRFAGPGKTDHELDVALTRGVGTIHVESLDELQSLADLAASRQAAAQVALRINLPQELQGARMRMGGRSSRFGVDLDQVPEAIDVIRARPHLDLRGLHVYGGTQTCDAHAFAAHARALCAHAARWERELDVRIDELDLGGGFGAPVFQGDPTFDLDAAGAALRELLGCILAVGNALNEHTYRGQVRARATTTRRAAPRHAGWGHARSLLAGRRAASRSRRSRSSRRARRRRPHPPPRPISSHTSGWPVLGGACGARRVLACARAERGARRWHVVVRRRLRRAW